MEEKPIKGKELMEYLGIGKKTLDRLKDEGLPFVPIGPKLHLYYVSKVNKFLANYRPKM